MVFFNSWEEWEEKQDSMHENIKKVCTVESEKEHNFMFVFGISPRQEVHIKSCLRNEILLLTNDSVWSEKVTSQVLIGIHGMFAALIKSDFWEYIHESKKQLSTMIYNNIVHQLDVILEDVPQIKCTICKKICIYDDDICYECSSLK